MAGSHDNLLSFIYSLTHPLSHLALLAILVLMFNQIYSAVSTDSVFMVFFMALLLFYLELPIAGSFLFIARFSFQTIVLFLSF